MAPSDDHTGPQGSGDLVRATREALGPNGALAQADPGFVEREVQQQLAEAMASAVEERATLVAEAGTGVGKTFAYLVPLLLSGPALLCRQGGSRCRCGSRRWRPHRPPDRQRRCSGCCTGRRRCGGQGRPLGGGRLARLDHPQALHRPLTAAGVVEQVDLALQRLQRGPARLAGLVQAVVDDEPGFAVPAGRVVARFHGLAVAGDACALGAVIGRRGGHHARPQQPGTRPCGRPAAHVMRVSTSRRSSAR